MGANFHTAYADGITIFAASSMEAPLSDLDRAISYIKNVIVHCDGVINYSSTSGQLTWNGPLRILFVRADGQLIQNIVAAGGVTLSDNQMAYVDLSEINDATVMVYAASLTTAAASTTKAYNRLVLAYRNAASAKLYPVGLRLPLSIVGDMQKSVYDPDGDGKVSAAAAADSAAGNTFPIGDGTNTDKTIQAATGAQNPPAIRYNTASGKWQYTGDGTTWTDFGAGDSGAAAFKTITVPGQADIVADSAGALTLVAGMNVTVTTNEANRSITIAASTGAGNGTPVNLWQLML
ncbi:MAG: hypothetical protein N2491_09705 [Negativicutes bacterium]|nr:hypothetical protein [Negativicutes bacterium]